MKIYKFLLPLLVGALAVLGVLAVLSSDRAAADVLREWAGNWYWKDGGWIDYAPSGVPDFDQKQDAWQDTAGNWSYCGPVAAANSLWWFDSKFEPSPVPPPAINDNYYLVTPYGAGQDDHDPLNVGGMGPLGLVDDLAWYFDTDGQRTSPGAWQGTEVHTMSYGLQWYLYGGNPAWGPSPYGPRYGSYYDDYHVQLVKMPTFEWVEEEVERSEDVVLLLGFWQNQGEWKRLGGHYVTVAGINSTDHQIAFSDPFLDSAEAGGAGRVLSGTIIVPHQPGHPPFVHNDAGNVSHDVYTVTLDAISPGGLWEIEGYKYQPNFERQNCPREFEGDQGDYWTLPVFTEVEYAIATSPFDWKPGGEWVWQWYGGEWTWEWWWYHDDGDSCLPDFWWELDPVWEAYDGPVAVANSFWWFDSKAETLVTGGGPTEPPTVSDHYSLTVAYGAWDDHAISNTVPFIEDLASQKYLDTGPQGTTIVSMTSGISAYLAGSGVASDFYTKTQDAPSWEWIADEVETCEDVILLLGFWEYIGGDVWERKGGHWVNAAGVNRDGWLIGLSDPALDNAITESVSTTLHLGRVFPPEHLGTPFTGTNQSSPQNISHDIYRVITSTSPGGQWALVDYPVTSLITDFIGLNGGGAAWKGEPISAEVEYAISVSPYSDLVITKTAVVTEVVPGKRVAFTLEYANTGLAAVHFVTITDMLPLSALANITYTAYPPIWASPNVTYVWTLPKLSYGQHGVITITAESRVTATLANTAYITGLNSIGGPTPDRNPDDNTSTVCDPVSSVGIQYTPVDPEVNQTVTFTATATGSDPITYTWGADDAWTASGVTATHAFAAAGNHTVWLTATNPCGQEVTSETLYVITRGVQATPISVTVSGAPSDTVCFTLHITNTGNVTDTFDVTHTFPISWNLTFTPSSPHELASGEAITTQVCIDVPGGANRGDAQTDTVVVTSRGNPNVSAEVDVTAWVAWRVYLPVILKNYETLS